MAKTLVIVESPTKSKTIEKFLGKNYTVKASMGHLRDLPKSTLGVTFLPDEEHANEFEPKYINIRGKGDLIKSLKAEAKKADKVLLATDPDREGEAISWHLAFILGIDQTSACRIEFHEITAAAVKDAIKHPRCIDMDMVDAQQARRILDRIVGYQLSPLLWRKIRKGLSAGRVQSVATKIVADRDREIEDFIPVEYWTLSAKLREGSKGQLFEAEAVKYQGKKLELHNEQEARAAEKALSKADYIVSDAVKKERKRHPVPPFTTSSMQQEANKKLNFSAKKTMMLAQQLYEGVEVKGEGTIGLITYLRTDSTRVSEEAEKMAKEYIEDRYGAEYAGEGTERKPGQKIQDAHEAIRPTAVSRIPLDIKDQLPRDLFRLYQLIWKRFTASRMQAAKYETVSVKIGAGEQIFTVASSKLLFDGFMSVYTQEDEEKEENNLLAGSLSKDTKLTFEEFEEKQHFTQPPAHYTEASLVRELEELGIGRPSTYAPTITTIMARHYVVKENKNLFVTELGEVVNNMMQEAFPAIVDVNFTANLETLLDGVGEGKVNWKTVVSNFYPDLDEAVKKAEQDLAKVQIADEESDEVCEHCGRKMVIKYGPHGKFLACPGFPECRNTKPYFEKIGVACPKCGKDIVIKKTKKGRKYYGCIGNPDCDFMVWQKPSAEKCPKCGSMMLQKGNKLVCMNE